MFILSMLLPNLLENKNLLKADASLERMAAYLSQSRASSDNDSFKWTYLLDVNNAFKIGASRKRMSVYLSQSRASNDNDSFYN